MTLSLFITVWIISSLYSFTETIMLSENQLEQICSDIDAMVLSGLSVDDLETFIKSEIENIKRNSPQKVFRHAGKTIDLSNNDEIDKNGQLFEVVGVGSGSSMTDMSSPYLVIQANDKGRESYIKQLQVNLALVAELTRRNGENFNLVEKHSPKSIQRLQSMEACKDLIQATNGKLNGPSSRKDETKVFGTEIMSDRSHSEPMSSGDLTSISTNSEIKSDGLAEYIINVSKDRATSSSLAQSTEDQIHNNYKGSDVHLVDIAFALNEG